LGVRLLTRWGSWIGGKRWGESDFERFHWGGDVKGGRGFVYPTKHKDGGERGLGGVGTNWGGGLLKKLTLFVGGLGGGKPGGKHLQKSFFGEKPGWGGVRGPKLGGLAVFEKFASWVWVDRRGRGFMQGGENHLGVI